MEDNFLSILWSSNHLSDWRTGGVSPVSSCSPESDPNSLHNQFHSLDVETKTKISRFCIFFFFGLEVISASTEVPTKYFQEIAVKKC